MKKFLFLLLAASLAFLPTGAMALDLAYDDGSAEGATAYGPDVASVVEFLPSLTDPTLTPESPVLLDTLQFYLVDSAPGAHDFRVTVWDASLAQVYDEVVTIQYVEPGFYPVELANEDLLLTGPFRVGFTVLQLPPTDPTIPPPPMVLLGYDESIPVPPAVRHSSAYTFSSDTWTPLSDSNNMIRASVTPATVLGCEGFLPPVHGDTLRIRKGARTVPLKARLYDDAGVPVDGDDITAPILKVFFTADPAAAPVEMPELVVPPGRSNRGASFRYTDWDLWKYNLKTKRFAVPGTYTATLSSPDVREFVVDPACTVNIVVTGPKPKHMPKSFRLHGRR